MAADIFVRNDDGDKLYNVYRVGLIIGHKGLDCTVMMYNKTHVDGLKFYGARTRKDMRMTLSQLEVLAVILKPKFQNSLLDFIAKERGENLPSMVDDVDVEPVGGVPEFNGEYMSSLQLQKIIKQVAGIDQMHKVIISNIEFMLNSGVAGHKFVPSSYIDANGVSRKAYNITRAGYLLYVSKFNDKVRERLIDRWEELEKQVRQPIQTPLATDPLSLLKAMVNALEEQKNQITGVTIKVTDLGERVSAIEEDRKAATQIMMSADLGGIAPVAKKSDRARLNELVRYYVTAKNVPYPEAWGKIAKEHYYRYHRRYKGIDEAEKLGYLPNCISIIAEMINEFKLNNK